MRLQGESLDRDYLLRWGRELGLESLLEQALREADAAGQPEGSASSWHQ